MVKPKKAVICHKLLTRNQSNKRENQDDSHDILHPVTHDSNITLPEVYVHSINNSSGYGSTILYDKKQEEAENSSDPHKANKES